MKKCPNCSSVNDDSRIRCKFCGGDLTTKPVDSIIIEKKVKDDGIYKYHSFLSTEKKVQLGKMYQSGIACEKNIEHAKNIYYEAAAEGSAEAMYLYAEILNQSPSVDDKKTAIYYYNEAAEQGYAGAKLKLKEINKNNQHVETNALMETVKKVRPYCLEIISHNVYKAAPIRSLDDLMALMDGRLEAVLNSVSQGSGVLLNNGYLITNSHVINRAYDYESEFGVKQEILGHINGRNSEIPLELVYRNVEEDIAILKPLVSVPDLTNAPKLMQPLNIQMGQSVFTIGNGHGVGNALTSGQISKELHIDGERREVFTTNMVINPGNSGGGVFNLDGDVLGMVTYGPAGDIKGTLIYGITYCVTSNTIQQMINKVTKKY